MSEEEKKAFSRLYMKATLYSADAEDYPNSIVSKRDLVIIINLIEKQQKEIENLKEINKEHQKKKKKIIQEMANYIKNEWGFANNDEVIDYFRKRCKQ